MDKIHSSLPVKIRNLSLLALGLLLLWGGASCRASAEQSSPTPDPSLTGTVEADEILPASTATEEQAAVEEQMEPEDQCLTCHADKAALIDTADPVVVVESENSGEG